MVAAVVVAASVVHHHLASRDGENLRGAAAYMAARTAGAQLRANGLVSRESLQRSCKYLVNQPGIWAVCLWDRFSKPMAAVAVDQNLERFLDKEGEIEKLRCGVRLVELPAGILPGQGVARRVDVDLGLPGGADQPAAMTILMDPSVPSSPGWARQAVYHSSVAGVGLSALLFGCWWLRREFLRPIRSLLGASSRGQAQQGRGDVVERNDELGAIARSLEGMEEEIQEWRARAETIERRMSSRIAAETQRISRELRKMQREVWTDSLTRINNRRLLDEKFPSIYAAQRSARQDLSVVMIDLDHFKQINDALGHTAGDALLKFAGELLRQCIRSDDFAVRYGGDEFLLILPGDSAEDATALAKRIVAMFTQRAKMIADIRPAPTMSVGIASLRRNQPGSAGDLIEAADQALYKAKQRGGRAICLAGEPSLENRRA